MANMPPDWASLCARIANFEPDDDAELLAFLRGEAAGLQGRAEALEHLQEHLVSGVRLDPASVQGIHAMSEGAAEDAGVSTRAAVAFKSTYQGTREDAARGVLMPHKGDFMTGEGD